MRIVSCAGFGVIARDPRASLDYFRDALGLALPDDETHAATTGLAGVAHFGVWALSGAAESCFGTPEWPADVPAPTSGIEFELESPSAVHEAEAELRAAGARVLVGAKDEPWGQTVCRTLSPDGVLVSVVYTPWSHG